VIGSPSGQRGAARHTGEVPRVSKVLVVDDDPVILRLLRVNFEMEGYRVATAADGLEGLASVRADRPHVIVSDIMMPKLDGLGFAAALKADPALATIPIVLLSAKAQNADIDAGLDIADDYVTKPFDPLELLDRVAALL
jgi:DNA-binding response OmpR family regulator